MNIVTRPQRKGEFEKPVSMKFWLSEVKLSTCRMTNGNFLSQTNLEHAYVCLTDTLKAC